MCVCVEGGGHGSARASPLPTPTPWRPRLHAPPPPPPPPSSSSKGLWRTSAMRATSSPPSAWTTPRWGRGGAGAHTSGARSAALALCVPRVTMLAFLLPRAPHPHPHPHPHPPPTHTHHTQTPTHPPARPPPTHTQIIAKCESRQSLFNFRSIVDAADAIIISRGNLGLDVVRACVRACVCEGEKAAGARGCPPREPAPRCPPPHSPTHPPTLSLCLCLYHRCLRRWP